MKRNLNKLKGNFLSDLYGRLFIKENTGNYGDVEMPSSSDALSIRASTSIVPEKMEEASEVKTNRRVKYKSKQMREKSKVVIDADLDASNDPAVEWSIGKLLKLLLGKRTVVASQVGASVSLVDSKSVVAGLTITTAGSLIGIQGNLAKIKFVLAGSTGSVSLGSISATEIQVNYYADSTVSDVVTAINAHADLDCVADLNGDDTTDLFSSLLAVNALSSGSSVYPCGGSNIGFQYDNSEDPEKDATLILNKEKHGNIVTGVILNKFGIEVTEKSPSLKIEGEAKYSMLTGISGIASNVVSSTKIYVTDEKQFGEVNDEAPQYVDIISADGKTYKYEALKIASTGFDTGHYIIVDSIVSCLTTDRVAYHEPANGYNPVVNPINGLGGSLQIGNVTYAQIRNVKVDFDNALEIHDNLAMQKTIAGFSASKFLNGKISATILAEKDKLGIFQSLTAGETITLPVIITLGNVAGKRLSIISRFVEFKAPDLSDKADTVQEFSLEGTIVADPEADNVPSLVVITH